MNTTAAAIQANVTIDTIRTWCRIGAVAAVKAAGRWVIDAASLAHRIAIGQRKARMAQPMYRIDEHTVTHYGTQRTAYTIVRTDGTPGGYGPGKDNRLHDATFFTRDLAEFYCEFYERTPVGCHLRTEHYRANSMNRGSYWLLTTSFKDDPSDLRKTWPKDQEVPENHPAGTRLIDVLVQMALTHAEGAPARIAQAAEKRAVAEAEATVHQAREDQLAQIRREKGALATPRQVDYILQLLAKRERTGEGGGFFYGPTDRAGIEEMSKADASAYITSLKGDY